MNLLNKAYCRTFQTVFKLAIPILPYRDPLVIRTTEDVGKVLKEKNIDSVPIVTDSALNSMGMLTTLYDTLDKAGICYTVFDETVPNPTVANVEEAKKLYLENNCKGLIGFGGGCVNDTIIHIASSHMGFGGVGESGMGGYHGKAGFDTFSHKKSIVDKKVWIDLPMRYQPYTRINEILIRTFLK